MNLELYQKSEFAFADSIHISIYVYDNVYDIGIIREIRICIRREHTYIYIYTYICIQISSWNYMRNLNLYLPRVYIYVYSYEYIYDTGIIREIRFCIR